MGIHDSLVAHAFADVDHARGVLATALPPEISARVDFSSLRPEKGSFVDADEGLLAALGDHVPRLTLVLDDLWKQSDDVLYARAATAFARLVLWALKHAREAGWLDGEHPQWKDLIATVLAERDGVRALTALFRYIAQASPAATRDALRGLLPEGRRDVEEAVMNWYQQQVVDGERRGERRGERAGEQRLLLKQLRLRFGELPAAVVAQVEAADVAELEIWAERVVTAARLEDVLGGAVG